jgi:uncharacterized protein (TIGR03084 family)
MFSQVIDFRDESEALYQLMRPLDADAFGTVTQFKQWTFNDVLGHLHLWNHAADLSLTDEAAFQVFIGEVFQYVASGSLRAFEKEWLAGLCGRELLEQWHGFVLDMSGRFGAADPQTRVKWAGPDMSVRSSITARLMETWAHGLAIYDALGVERVDTDRIRNIAVLGVNTFGWTFRNRQLEVPARLPYLRLIAPSGAIWEWGEVSEAERVEGSATEFCQVVTQTRNVADTALRVSGDTASAWMRIAQCFAGPPEQPPAPGARFVQRPQ